jgi:hypothetical protein
MTMPIGPAENITLSVCSSSFSLFSSLFSAFPSCTDGGKSPANVVLPKDRLMVAVRDVSSPAMAS